MKVKRAYWIDQELADALTQVNQQRGIKIGFITEQALYHYMKEHYPVQMANIDVNDKLMQ